MPNKKEKLERTVKLLTFASFLPALLAPLIKNGDIPPDEWLLISGAVYASSRLMAMIFISISLRFQLSVIESRLEKNPEHYENSETDTVDKETSEQNMKLMKIRYQFYAYINIYIVWLLMKGGVIS